MHVSIVGAGYVGLTTGVALAFLGHRVTLIDINPEVINALKKGVPNIYEYGLSEMMERSRGNMSYDISFAGVSLADVVLIAVGTPSTADGDADMSFYEGALTQLAENLSAKSYPIIVNKSTVPPGTALRAQTFLNSLLSARGLSTGIKVASNPEFLREGNALMDALYPDRIVVGSADQSVVLMFKELYGPIIDQSFRPPKELPRPLDYSGPSFFATDPVSGEIIKYAANAFLAMKISFINEIAGLAELLNGDIADISGGIGLDSRIGAKYLQAGAGWGGSCFGKDARAIICTAGKYAYPLTMVEAAIEVNSRQRRRIAGKLKSVLNTIPGSKIGILGVAFKAGTDDVRDTPATDIINELIGLGAFIKVYDPMAMKNFRKMNPHLKVEYVSGLEELTDECDALVLLTDWEQFKTADWAKLAQAMNSRVIVDGRNVLEPAVMQQLGFNYQGIGRRLDTVSVKKALL